MPDRPDTSDAPNIPKALCLGCGDEIPRSTPFYLGIVETDVNGEPRFGFWCLECGPGIIDEDGNSPRYIDPVNLRETDKPQ